MSEAPPPNNSIPPDRVDEFVALLGQNQRRLFVYVMSLMHDRDGVDEVLQETNLVLWREFPSFQPGTNFTAWACRIAYHQVLAWGKKRQRDRLKFSAEFLQSVSEELDVESEHLENRLAALTECLKRLPKHQSQLIWYRYTSGDAIEEIAQRTQRTVDAVYRMLSRVRQTLHDCVSKSLSAGESP